MHKIIDWYIGMENDWPVETGALGKNFKDYLSPETWADLKETYTGADLAANWKAFFKMTDFFRRLAKEVGNELGYEYLDEVDQEVIEFCREIKDK